MYNDGVDNSLGVVEVGLFSLSPDVMAHGEDSCRSAG